MIQRHSIALLLIVILSGCGYKPVPYFIGSPDHTAPPIYKQGWYDGCESAMSAYGNNFYKIFYTYVFDRELAKHSDYAKAWRDSYGYCRHHAYTYTKFGFFD